MGRLRGPAVTCFIKRAKCNNLLLCEGIFKELPRQWMYGDSGSDSIRRKQMQSSKFKIFKDATYDFTIKYAPLSS